MTRLSSNFSLEEFTISQTAKRLGIENEPTLEQVEKLRLLVSKLLQPLRYKFGAIHVTSGYRSDKLNEAIGGAQKGGKQTSQHCKAEAVDFKCENMAMLFNYVAKNCNFDQLIWEFGDDKQPSWIHLSYKEKGNRKQVLKAYTEKGKTKYKNL